MSDLLFKQNRAAPFSTSVRPGQYLQAIRGSIWRSHAEEVYLRTRLWWRLNDPKRPRAEAGPDLQARENEYHQLRLRLSWNSDTGDASLSTIENENLKCLVDLLDTGEPSNLLIRAECFRELGLFAMCEVELRKIIVANLRNAVAVIRHLAAEGNGTVAILPVEP